MTLSVGWIYALYIDEDYRGHAYGSLSLERAKNDAGKFGFNSVYLFTDHIGYYEQYGFNYLGKGYHPWGESSRIYQSNTSNNQSSQTCSSKKRSNYAPF